MLDETAVPAALLKGQLVDFRRANRSWLKLLNTLRNDKPEPARNGNSSIFKRQVVPVLEEARAAAKGNHEATAQLPANPMKLRSRQISELTIQQVETMLQEWNFFDKTWQRSGKGVQHQYEALQPFGDQIVVDHTTGLTWQRGGSDNWKHFADARQYIAQLNSAYYGGYSDWRLPTLEEAMSLVEPDLVSNKMHISSFFSPEQRYIWTADKLCEEVVWFVAFPNGGVGSCRVSNFNSVRAVRKDS